MLIKTTPEVPSQQYTKTKQTRDFNRTVGVTKLALEKGTLNWQQVEETRSPAIVRALKAIFGIK